jgi:hypothetical protein
MADWRHPYEDLLRIPLKNAFVASAWPPPQAQGKSQPAFCGRDDKNPAGSPITST